MKEILAKADELIAVCELRLKKIDQERQSNQNWQKQLEDQSYAQNEKQKELDKREAKIKALELSAEQIGQASSILNSAKEDAGRLEAAQNKFKEVQQGHELKIKNDSAELDRQRDKIQEEARALELDKRSYRIKIKDEIIKNMGK